MVYIPQFGPSGRLVMQSESEIDCCVQPNRVAQIGLNDTNRTGFRGVVILIAGSAPVRVLSISLSYLHLVYRVVSPPILSLVVI